MCVLIKFLGTFNHLYVIADDNLSHIMIEILFEFYIILAYNIFPTFLFDYLYSLAPLSTVSHVNKA